MKKLILPVFIATFLTQCTINKKPEFLEVQNLSVAKASLDEVTLKAEALFENKNSLGGTLWADGIKVYIDSMYVATVSADAFEVPAKDTFSVPLTVTFPTEKLLADRGKGLLGSLLKQVLAQKVTTQFKGDLRYKVVGFSASYPIDHIEEIEIKW
ncbi:MAG: hypothetical protein AB3N16_09935 [Flavobacteriaceae bacterium]